MYMYKKNLTLKIIIFHKTLSMITSKYFFFIGGCYTSPQAALLFFPSHSSSPTKRIHQCCRTLASGAWRRGNPRLVSGSFCVKESPPSIMVIRKPNWSFRDSKARDWLRKGKVLAPLVRHT